MKKIGVPFLFVLLDTALLCAHAFGQEVTSPGDGRESATGRSTS